MNTHSAHEAGSLPPSPVVTPDLLPAALFAFPQGYRLLDDCADPDLIQRYIAAQMGRTVEACLEIGHGLYVLKALCQHGEFMRRIGDLGVNDRLARRFMAAFRRFSNAASVPILATVGKQTKLFELLPLDDEQLEELAVNGQIGPLVLSEIPSMAVKAVRETVQKIRKEQQQAVDVILEEKNKLVDSERFCGKSEALQSGDRIESLHARRPGAVVKVYADGSACVCWDDGGPQEAGLGHERMPRELLVKVAGLDGAGQPVAPDVVGDTGAVFNDAPGQVLADAVPADDAYFRRVDTQLTVHFAGRVYNVAPAGVGVGDDVMCTPAPIAPFIWVRKLGAAPHEAMATMVQPIEPEPEPKPLAPPPDPPATNRIHYLRDRMALVLQYADGDDLDCIGATLQKVVEGMAARRYLPDMVADDYDLTYRFLNAGGAQ